MPGGAARTRRRGRAGGKDSDRIFQGRRTHQGIAGSRSPGLWTRTALSQAPPAGLVVAAPNHDKLTSSWRRCHTGITLSPLLPGGATTVSATFSRRNDRMRVSHGAGCQWSRDDPMSLRARPIGLRPGRGARRTARRGRGVAGPRRGRSGRGPLAAAASLLGATRDHDSSPGR